MNKINKKALARLIYLNLMLSKYAHRYNGGEYSYRMSVWIMDYNNIKEDESKREAWTQFCETKNYSHDHDAYDSFS